MAGMRSALEDARHELTTLHGLLAADGAVPDQTWTIDTSATVEEIDAALDVGMTPLVERIEAAYDRAIQARRDMIVARNVLANIEANAKQEHEEEWASAKNNDVRAVLLAGWIAESPTGDTGDDYFETRAERQEAELAFKLALLEIERLKLLVEAAKAGA